MHHVEASRLQGISVAVLYLEITVSLNSLSCAKAPDIGALSPRQKKKASCRVMNPEIRSHVTHQRARSCRSLNARNETLVRQKGRTIYHLLHYCMGYVRTSAGTLPGNRTLQGTRRSASRAIIRQKSFLVRNLTVQTSCTSRCKSAPWDHIAITSSAQSRTATTLAPQIESAVSRDINCRPVGTIRSSAAGVLSKKKAVLHQSQINLPDM